MECTVNEVIRNGEFKRRLLMLIGDMMVVQCACQVKACMKVGEGGCWVW